MKKRPTIRDVAAAAEVSIAVVSRVLNEGSGPVAPATRERVLDVMQRLSYSPHSAARELKSNPATTIGLVLADVTNPFFASLADAVVREARARGVQVLLTTTQEDERLEGEALLTLASRRVAGVIATPASTDGRAWRRLLDLGTRIVFVDRFIDEVQEADVVSIDNERSSREATEHLLGLGHRRIGFISGPMSTSTGRSRIQGHLAALTEHGLQQSMEFVRSVPFRGTQGADAVGSLLDLPEPPTALIIANTAQVVNSMRRIRQSGIAVPRDLSVVVFDDNPWTELYAPSLTIMRQPISLLAAHSVDLTLSASGAPESEAGAGRRLDRTEADPAGGGMESEPENAASGRFIAVQAEFVVRSSTSSPRV